MKRFLIPLLWLFTLGSYAQDVKITRLSISSSSIVKDDSGAIVAYEDWKRLLKSGDYSIKNYNGGDFTLHKKTEEEKKAPARMKSPTTSALKPKPSDAFREGEKFKGEKITDMDGNKFDLRKPDGKVYVLNFWFINCPPCKREIPDLNEMVTKYKDNKDVVFLAIALDQYRELKDFLKFMPFDYKIVDDGRYYSTKYGVKGFPTHVVIGKDGLIKFSTSGLMPTTVKWIDKTIKEQFETN